MTRKRSVRSCKRPVLDGGDACAAAPRRHAGSSRLMRAADAIRARHPSPTLRCTPISARTRKASECRRQQKSARIEGKRRVAKRDTKSAARILGHSQQRDGAQLEFVDRDARRARAQIARARQVLVVGYTFDPRRRRLPKSARAAPRLPVKSVRRRRRCM